MHVRNLLCALSSQGPPGPPGVPGPPGPGGPPVRLALLFLGTWVEVWGLWVAGTTSVCVSTPHPGGPPAAAPPPALGPSEGKYPWGLIGGDTFPGFVCRGVCQLQDKRASVGVGHRVPSPPRPQVQLGTSCCGEWGGEWCRGGAAIVVAVPPVPPAGPRRPDEPSASPLQRCDSSASTAARTREDQTPPGCGHPPVSSLQPGAWAWPGSWVGRTPEVVGLTAVCVSLPRGYLERSASPESPATPGRR